MADEDKFQFEEEESFLVAEADQEEPEEAQTVADPDPAPPRQGSMLRILLLVLLLVLLGAIGFYYLVGIPGIPEPAPQAVKKPVVVPPKVQPPPPETPAPAAEKAAETTPAVPVEPAPQQAAPSAKPVPAAAEPARAAKTVPEAPSAAPTAIESPAAPVPAAPQVTATSVPAAGGDYTVQVGAFLLDSSRKEVEAALGRLGFQALAEPVTVKSEMVRLRIGAFPLAEARARLAELQAELPGAFLLVSGEEGVVYAGSYRILDQARREADRLYAGGLRVEEEPVTVPVAAQRVYFGPFTERAEAQAAADKARAAGLEALVLKRP